MTTLLIATRNAHKAAEIRALLGDDFRYMTLNDFPAAPAVIEDAETFAGNATKKAVALAKWLTEHKSDEWRVTSDKNQARRRKSSHVTCHPSPDTFCVLADDSGLEVDAMHGAPGVQSARFAALGGQANSSDSANNAKLLRLLKDVPAEQRAARFRCVIALVAVQHLKSEIRSPKLFEGVCEGRIAFAPRGKRGFGYDPLFVPDGFDKTFAELGAEVKNRMSHRARALAKLKSALEVNALSLP